MSTNPVDAYGGAASNWIYGSICGSEAHTGGGGLSDQPSIVDLEIFPATAINRDLEEKWITVYDGIERTNTVLRVMREAKDMLEKTNGAESPVKIIDLEHEDGSAAGTEVIIKMPVIYE